MGEDGAPLLPFVTTVGVTGHRRQALPDELAHLRKEASSILSLLRDVAIATQADDSQWFADEPPSLRLLSPVADGADQMVANAGLELGFELDVVLPFARQSYRATLHSESDRRCFDELIERSSRVLELPGEGPDDSNGYVMAGRATVAHCDLLIAIWDGERARGHGGTADVVDLALRRGIPVIHVDPAGARPTRLLWSGFDPAAVTERPDHAVHRPFDEKHLKLYFSSVLQPPPDADERRFLAKFYGEKQRRRSIRIEYPLLLAIAGVAPLKTKRAHPPQQPAEVADQCAGSSQIDNSQKILRHSYAWSDALASLLAQTYRSGHVFNFLLGGIAVCIGLTANILPQFLFQFAVAEGAVTAAILVNTRLGVRNQWHRRWLDYRQLAERLRPMGSLKLLAVAAPVPPGTRANPLPRRWTEWYALAVWRAIGSPCDSIDPKSAADRGDSVAQSEIAPQIAYHERHARQIELLDRRLERIGAALFQITLLAACAVVVGAAFDPDLVNRYNPWLGLIGAGFPALGTAVFGIRFQGDFGGSAVRSQNTANALKEIDSELRQAPTLMRAADLAEQASVTMLVDLDQWRLVNQQQELDLL